MSGTIFKKAVSVIASIAIAVAFVPIAPLAGQHTEQAFAKKKATITVTRVATGKLTMKKGSTYKLGAKASKGKLKYKSSNSGVVKVSKKGKLTAKKKGKAVITIKGKGAKKKVKVTVVSKKKFKKVKKIKIKASKKTLTVGQQTRVRVTFTPKKASNKNVIYKSSKPAVATVSTLGVVIAKKAGTAKITVTSCEKKKAKKTIKIKVVAKKAAPKPSTPSTTTEEYDDPDQEVPHSKALDIYSDEEDTYDEDIMRPMGIDPEYDNEITYKKDVKVLKGVAWNSNDDGTYTIDPETLSGETLEVNDRVVFEPTDENPQGAWFVVENINEGGTVVTPGDPADYVTPEDEGTEDDEGDGEATGGDDPNPNDVLGSGAEGDDGTDESEDPDATDGTVDGGEGEDYDDDYSYDDENYYYDDGDYRENYSEQIAQTLPYENLDVETVGTVAETGFTPAEGVEVLETEQVEVDIDEVVEADENNEVIELGSDGDEADDPDADAGSNKDTSPKSSAKKANKDALGVGGEAKVALTKFKMKVKNFEFSVQPTAEVKVDVDWFSVNELYAAITMREELSGQLEMSTDSDSIKLGDFYFSTPVPGLVLELATYLNIDASGKVKVVFGASQTMGYSYRHGQSKMINETNTGDVKLEAEAKIEVGLDETVSINIFAKPLVDLSIGAEFELAWENFKARSAGVICSDLNLSFFGFVEIGKHKSLLSDCGINFEKETPKLRVKSWHIENNKFVGRCNYEKGTVEGYVKDANTGKGIKATVKVYTDQACTKECTSSSGLKLLQATDGWYKFEALAGTYYIKLSHPSYNSDTKKVTVKKEVNVHAGTSVLVAKTTSTGSGSSGSNTVNANTYRVVLTWGKNPEDLDSHYRVGSTHVYYEQMSQGNASLDVDDTVSYGPETITVTKLGNGFKYAVHDYTNAESSGASTALSYSGAKVVVYKGNTKVKEFNVTKKKRGTLWTVFEIDKNGSIKTINKMSYQKDSSKVGA